MATKQLLKRREMSLPVAIAVGLAASVIITLLGTGILAYLISNETAQESAVGPAGIVIQLLGSATGGFLSYGLVKKQRVVVCAMSALCYFLVLLGMTALIFGGQYQGIGSASLAVIGGGVLSVLPGFLKRGSGGKRPKFKAFR